MLEPISSALTTAKIIGLVLATSCFTAVAYLIVVLFEIPKSGKEWALSLASTVVFSLGGGSLTLAYFELSYLVDMPHPLIGWFAIGFIFFIWGLLGWFLLRMLFLTIRNNSEQDAFELGQKIRGLVFGDSYRPDYTNEFERPPAPKKRKDDETE